MRITSRRLTNGADMSIQQIMVVEDNENDRFFLQTAFEKEDIQANIIFAVSAEDAIEKFDEISRPLAIITDLNMPGAGGFGLLEHLRSDAALKHVPTIVFSGSANPDDINSSYEHEANAYVMKPDSVEGYKGFVSSFSSFWVEQNRVA
ncbi:MAG: hypothetical protein CBB65_08455 [Hyphomonadaceae bacterium TMED5]|nr:response regulator [Ponticaulis sp.]OUY00155.1 MAG: hypothetical protein CBB65_08455 [Hyphomonadaceae bacterium TMED5]